LSSLKKIYVYSKKQAEKMAQKLGLPFAWEREFNFKI